MYVCMHVYLYIWKVYRNICKYSQVPLSGHFYKVDTSLRRHLLNVPAKSNRKCCIFVFCKMDTSLEWTRLQSLEGVRFRDS